MGTRTRNLKLIGISGKPGSVKMRYAAPIIQELKYHGFKTIQVSLAETLYKDINSIIDKWHNSPMDLDTQHKIAKEHNISSPLLDKLLCLLNPNGLGEKYDFGYSRRNENMRKALNLLGSDIRREQDEDFFIKQMIDNIPAGTEFAVFADLRYPNEADYLNANGGYPIRIIEPPQEAYSRPEDGFKYSQEGLNDPTETALDNYQHWYAIVEPQIFRGDKFIKELLEEEGLPVKPEQIYAPDLTA